MASENRINWQEWCGDKVPWLCVDRPIILDGYKYATDGKIAIRYPTKSKTNTKCPRGYKKLAPVGPLFDKYFPKKATSWKWPETPEQLIVDNSKRYWKRNCGKCKGKARGCKWCKYTGNQSLIRLVRNRYIQFHYWAMADSLNPNRYMLGKKKTPIICFEFGDGGQGMINQVECPKKDGISFMKASHP